MQGADHACGPAPCDNNSGSEGIGASDIIDESAGVINDNFERSDSNTQAGIVSAVRSSTVLREISKELYGSSSRSPLYVNRLFKIVLHVPLSPLVDHVMLSRLGCHENYFSGDDDARRRMAIHSSALVKIAVDRGSTYMADMTNEKLERRLEILEKIDKEFIKGSSMMQPAAPMNCDIVAHGALAHGAQHTAVAARRGLPLLDEIMHSASAPAVPVTSSAHCVCGRLQFIPDHSVEADAGVWVLLCDGVSGLHQQCKYGQAFHAACLGIDADTAQRIVDGQRREEPCAWRCESCSAAVHSAELPHEAHEPSTLRVIQQLQKLSEERDAHDNALQAAVREGGDVDQYTVLTEPVARELSRYYNYEFGPIQHALHNAHAAGHADGSDQALTALLAAAIAVDSTAAHEDSETVQQLPASEAEQVDNVTRTERFLAYLLAPHRVNAYVSPVGTPDVGIVNHSLGRRMAVYLPAFQHSIQLLAALVEAKWVYKRKHEKYCDKGTVKQMMRVAQETEGGLTEGQTFKRARCVWRPIFNINPH